MKFLNTRIQVSMGDFPYYSKSILMDDIKDFTPYPNGTIITLRGGKKLTTANRYDQHTIEVKKELPSIQSLMGGIRKPLENHRGDK